MMQSSALAFHASSGWICPQALIPMAGQYHRFRWRFSTVCRRMMTVFSRLPVNTTVQLICCYCRISGRDSGPAGTAIAQSGSARVGVLDPAYAEHGFRWQQAGHEVECLEADQIEDRLAALDVLVLINPCNPSAIRFNPDQLRSWHSMLAQRGGWLLVDEAFIDATPEQSLITDPMPSGLIVLRSLGKFFGLAGIRVGAVCADASVRSPCLDSWGLGPSAIRRDTLPAWRWQTGLASGDESQPETAAGPPAGTA